MAGKKSKRKAKSGAAGKIIVATLVAAVIAAGTCVAGYCSRNDAGKWFSESDLTKWSWKKDNAQAPGTEGKAVCAIDGEGKEMRAGVTYAMPAEMTLLNEAPAEELVGQSVTITAAHDFKYNSVKVRWTVTNAAGADMSDYVTVTPTEEGSLTATVALVQRFTEQLTLTVSEWNHPESKASCKLDCLSKVWSLKTVSYDGLCDFTYENTDGTLEQNYVNFTVDQSDILLGTKMPDRIVVTGLTLEHTEYFYEKINEYTTFNVPLTDYTYADIDITDYCTFDEDGIWTDDYWLSLHYSDLISGFDDFDEEHKQAIYYAWYTAYEDINKRVTDVPWYQNFEVYGDIVMYYKGYDISYCSITTSTVIHGYHMGENLAPNLTLNNTVTLG